MSGVDRDRLVAHLDRLLSVAEWPDKSLNGLQVEGAERVERVALATDAALATIDMADEAGAGFLIVHHGLFWGRVEPVTGPHRARLAALLEREISLYCAHLPLDARGLLGFEQPALILLTCYRVLHANDDPRAAELLQLRRFRHQIDEASGGTAAGVAGGRPATGSGAGATSVTMWIVARRGTSRPSAP